jgi:hypothetical protein
MFKLYLFDFYCVFLIHPALLPLLRGRRAISCEKRLV